MQRAQALHGLADDLYPSLKDPNDRAVAGSIRATLLKLQQAKKESGHRASSPGHYSTFLEHHEYWTCFLEAMIIIKPFVYGKGKAHKLAAGCSREKQMELTILTMVNRTIPEYYVKHPEASWYKTEGLMQPGSVATKIEDVVKEVHGAAPMAKQGALVLSTSTGNVQRFPLTLQLPGMSGLRDDRTAATYVKMNNQVTKLKERVVKRSDAVRVRAQCAVSGFGVGVCCARCVLCVRVWPMRNAYYVCMMYDVCRVQAAEAASAGAAERLKQAQFKGERDAFHGKLAEAAAERLAKNGLMSPSKRKTEGTGSAPTGSKKKVRHGKKETRQPTVDHSSDNNDCVAILKALKEKKTSQDKTLADLTSKVGDLHSMLSSFIASSLSGSGHPG